METLEKFKNDVEYNAEHQLIAPFDDENLGQRMQGGFVKIDKDDEGIFKHFTFDNGNNYTYDFNTKMLYDCKPIPQEYFIHKYIEKCIYDIIANNSGENNPRIYCGENEIESYDDNPIIIVRVVIHRDYKTVCVTNIHVQIQYKGYGKKLLSEIYKVCKMVNYKLQLTDMMPHFYNRMRHRGAKKVLGYNDRLEITDNTDLSSHSV